MFSLERAMMNASRLLETRAHMGAKPNRNRGFSIFSKRILAFALNPDAPPGSLLLRMNLSSVWKFTMPASSWVASTLSVALTHFPNAKLRTREEGTAGEGFCSLTSE